MIFLWLVLLTILQLETFLATSPECPILVPLTENTWTVTQPRNEQNVVFCSGDIMEQCPYPPIPDSPYLQLGLMVPGELTLTTNFAEPRSIKQIQLTFVGCMVDPASRWVQNSTLEVYLNNEQLIGTVGCGDNSGAYTNQSMIFLFNLLADSLSLILSSNEIPPGMPSMINIGQVMLI